MTAYCVSGSSANNRDRISVLVKLSLQWGETDNYKYKVKYRVWQMMIALQTKNKLGGG